MATDGGGVTGWQPKRGAAVVAVAGAALSAIVPMALVPALPAMARAFDGSMSGTLLAQLVIAAPAAMIAVAAPFAGSFASRFGLRRCLLAALAVYAAMGLLGFFLSDPIALIASRLVLGAATGFITTLSIAIAAMFAPAQRDRLLGFSSASGSAAAVVALSVSGWLVDGIGWRAPFALYFAGLVILLVAWVSVRHAAGRTAAPSPSAPPPVAVDWPRLAPLYAMMLLFAVGFFMPGVQGPFLLLERGVTSAAVQGGLISLMAASSAIAAFSYGFVSRRLGSGAMILLTGATLGGGLAICGLFTGMPVIAAGLILAGVGAGFGTPTIMTRLLDAVPPASHARALGINYTAIFGGQFLNPVLLAPIIAAFGIGPAFVLTGAVIFAGALAMGFARRPASAAAAGT